MSLEKNSYKFWTCRLDMGFFYFTFKVVSTFTFLAASVAVILKMYIFLRFDSHFKISVFIGCSYSIMVGPTLNGCVCLYFTSHDCSCACYSVYLRCVEVLSSTVTSLAILIYPAESSMLQIFLLRLFEAEWFFRNIQWCYIPTNLGDAISAVSFF